MGYWLAILLEQSLKGILKIIVTTVFQPSEKPNDFLNIFVLCRNRDIQPANEFSSPATLKYLLSGAKVLINTAFDRRNFPFTNFTAFKLNVLLSM
ncbi:hypothetical protein AS299_04695 [Citrobacter freundii]|nr:hypothetical protein ABR34_01265 [Citrobacter braakii]OCF81575.1 hypothetical protein AS299_04695 [Citrobacter freundii]